MSTSFLHAARQGRNQWWRYLLSLLLIGFFWIILGSLPLVLWGLSQADRFTLTPTEPIAQIWLFVVLALSFCFFLTGLGLAVRFIHQRSLRSLIRADAPLNYGRLWQGASLWSLFVALPYGIEALLAPGHFAWTFQPSAWFLLLLLAAVLIPIQAATEELFFRGYLLQGLGLITHNLWVLLLVINGIFALLHLGNPEVEASNSLVWIALNYFAFGVFFTLVTLQDQSLELAIGAHTANNLFLAVLVRPQVSVLNTPALITQTVGTDARTECIIFLIQATLFYWLCFCKRPSRI